MTAQVIDALLVTLGLDPADFDKNSAKAVKDAKSLGKKINDVLNDRSRQDKRRDDEQKKRDREAEQRNKKSVEGFKSVRNEVIKLAAIFTAGVGIKEFFSSTINGSVSLGYLSANLSMSTERISAFQRASERAGGTSEGMTAQLKESVDTLAQLKMGMGPSEGLQWFFRLGGSSSDLKDGNSYLMARAKIIHDMFAVDPGKAALMAKQMGISEDQFDFIKQGPDAIKALVDAQEKNSAVSKKDAAAALELKNKMLDLRDSLQSTATRILLQLAPAIEQLFAKLEKGAAWVAAHKEDIARWVDDAVKWIKQFSESADSAASAVGGWKNVLLGLLAINVGVAAAGILGLANSIVALATGLTGLAGSAAGLSVLAKLGLVGAAGAAGYGVGTLISKSLPDSVQDAIGEFLARTMASLGNKDAGEAIRVNTGKDDYLTGPGARGGRSSKEALRLEASRQWAQAGLPAKAGAQSSGDLFKRLEAQYGLPAGILDSVWSAESSRGKNMLSPKGAQGHFGFMSGTAKEFGLSDPSDLGSSADAAARKLKGLLDYYNGDVGKAAAAYNWGQGNLDRKGLQNAPTETIDYMAKIQRGIGQGNALAAAQMPAGASASVPASMNTKTTSVKTDTTINGGIHIHTQATDAEGIAREIGPGIEKYNSPMQANTGIN